MLSCLIDGFTLRLRRFGVSVLGMLFSFALCLLVVVGFPQRLGSYLESLVQCLPSIKTIFTRFIPFASVFVNKDPLGAVTTSALSEIKRATTVVGMMRDLNSNAVRLSTTAVLPFSYLSKYRSQ